MAALTANSVYTESLGSLQLQIQQSWHQVLEPIIVPAVLNLAARTEAVLVEMQEYVKIASQTGRCSAVPPLGEEGAAQLRLAIAQLDASVTDAIRAVSWEMLLHASVVVAGLAQFSFGFLLKEFALNVLKLRETLVAPKRGRWAVLWPFHAVQPSQSPLRVVEENTERESLVTETKKNPLQKLADTLHSYSWGHFAEVRAGNLHFHAFSRMFDF